MSPVGSLHWLPFSSCTICLIPSKVKSGLITFSDSLILVQQSLFCIISQSWNSGLISFSLVCSGILMLNVKGFSNFITSWVNQWIHHLKTFGGNLCFYLPKLLLNLSHLHWLFFDNLIEITYYIINYSIKSSDLAGQVLHPVSPILY